MAFSLCLAEEERLAEVIKAFPCLYDKSSKGYKEKDVIANAWNAVADQLDFIADGKRAQTCFANLKKKGTKVFRSVSIYALDRRPRDGRTNIKKSANRKSTEGVDETIIDPEDENPLQEIEEHFEHDESQKSPQPSDDESVEEVAGDKPAEKQQPKAKKPRTKIQGAAKKSLSSPDAPDPGNGRINQCLRGKEGSPNKKYSNSWSEFGFNLEGLGRFISS